jgi:hypothetical protein
MQEDINKILYATFKDQPVIHKEELIRVLRSYYPHYDNPKTLAWRIHDLKTRGIIHQIARASYSLADKKGYIPEITTRLRDVFQLIKDKLPYVTTCIHDTRWFNEFMQHQVFRTFLVFEAERDAIDSVFYILQDNYRVVFLDPSIEVITHYLSSAEDSIVVIPMITESPTLKQEAITIPSIEKLLVDCLAEKQLYGAQSSEIEPIFKAAFERYAINTSTLKRYARRRNREKEVNKLIKTTLNHDQ